MWTHNNTDLATTLHRVSYVKTHNIVGGAGLLYGDDEWFKGMEDVCHQPSGDREGEV